MTRRKRERVAPWTNRKGSVFYLPIAQVERAAFLFGADSPEGRALEMARQLRGQGKDVEFYWIDGALYVGPPRSEWPERLQRAIGLKA